MKKLLLTTFAMLCIHQTALSQSYDLIKHTNQGEGQYFNGTTSFAWFDTELLTIDDKYILHSVLSSMISDDMNVADFCTRWITQTLYDNGYCFSDLRDSGYANYQYYLNWYQFLSNKKNYADNYLSLLELAIASGNQQDIDFYNNLASDYLASFGRGVMLFRRTAFLNRCLYTPPVNSAYLAGFGLGNYTNAIPTFSLEYHFSTEINGMNLGGQNSSFILANDWYGTEWPFLSW